MSELPERVLCTCAYFRCKEKFYVNASGAEQPGQLIPRSTRSNHRRKDAQIPAFDTTKASTSAQNQTTQSAIEHNEEHSIQTEQQSEFGPSETVSTPTIHETERSLLVHIATLAAWLYIGCGLSRASTGRVLKFLEMLLTLAIGFGRLLSQSSPTSITSPPLNSLSHFPRDVRFAMSALSIEPTIIHSICCPKCFSKYTLNSLPEKCSYRESARSKVCGEELWTIRTTRGGPRVVPRRLYSIQDFVSWLEYFLSCPGIEDLIDRSYNHQPSPDNMQTVWDSPAWYSLGTFTTTPGNLTFSYYIDWFNPLMNKIAGKSVSCGAIIMFCLNLPYEYQGLPEYTFFAGITPPPHEPTMTTMTHLADPIVDQLEAMWVGKCIRTRRYPAGAPIRVGVLCGIGDLLAIRKAMGFAGVSSHNFCSFCTLQLHDIEVLDSNLWKYREGVDVISNATSWMKATTKKDRKLIFQKHGVRWSSLHRLSYRDPVRHTMLGVMHNWIEGLLQHQARVKWGIGITPNQNNRAMNQDQIPTSPPLASPAHMDLDIDMLDEELNALHNESQQFGDIPTHLKRLHSEATLLTFDDCNDSDSAIDDDEFQPISESDSDTDVLETDDELVASACIFDDVALKSIQACLAESVIPSWLERPPTNLGAKSHGKLKADQWLQLFSVFLPLILPELWTLKSGCVELLDNFHDLVACTNILCAYSVSPASADRFHEHYVSYRKSSRTLFPNVKSRPNHHYAMHNVDLMKFWGPLIRLSEFPYERHNGKLQKINTNGHQWELDFTMLRQICRRGRLNGFLRGTLLSDPLSGPGASLHTLPPAGTTHLPAFGESQLSPVSPLAEAHHNLNCHRVSATLYDMILSHVNGQRRMASKPHLRHYTHIPHPLNAHILPPVALSRRHFKLSSREYSTFEMHEGNSSVGYRGNDGHYCGVGFIQSAWSFLVDGWMEDILVLSPHKCLTPMDQARNPYTLWPGFQHQEKPKLTIKA